MAVEWGNSTEMLEVDAVAESTRFYDKAATLVKVQGR